MTSDNIWSRVRRKPFVPFQLNTSDGKSFDVWHPEMITVTKNTVFIAIYDAGENASDEPASREVFISPLHVTSVEDMPPYERQAS